MAARGHQTKTAAGRAPGRGAGRAVRTALLLLPIVAVLLPTCVVLLIGMMPTAVAAMVDRTRERFLAMTVGQLNFCGALPGVVDLWRAGQAYGKALEIVEDPYFWLMSYAAAGVGWLVYLTLPMVLTSYYGLATSRRVEALRRRQDNLVAVWGEEVAGGDSGAKPAP